MEINFKSIKNELLAPGDVFWKKKFGETVLVSKKGEVFNSTLIQKLDNAEQIILIENCIDLKVHEEFKLFYLDYRDELLMREKIKLRNRLIEFLRVEFIEKEKVQFELNLIAWKLFSNFSHAEGLKFIERDSELFKRHLSVASSYTFCAFLLGYYDTKFLNKLFSTTFGNLMELGNTINAMTLKETLEYLCMQESFNPEDYETVKEIASPDLLSKTVVFEKYDGSGLRNINSREMSDLEIIFVAINGAFSFTKQFEGNIFLKIMSGDIRIEQKTLKMLQRILTKVEVEKSTIEAVG